MSLTISNTLSCELVLLPYFPRIDRGSKVISAFFTCILHCIVSANPIQQAAQGQKLPVILIAEKVTDKAVTEIVAYNENQAEKEFLESLETQGLHMLKLRSGLLIYDERSIGLHELRARHWVLESILAKGRSKTLSKVGGFDQEVKGYLASMSRAGKSSFMASDITVAFNPIAILGFQIGDGREQNVSENLYFNGEPPVRPESNRLKESPEKEEPAQRMSFQRWPSVKLEERFFNTKSANLMARLRREASEQIENLVKQEQENVDLKTSQVLNGLPLGIKRLAEKLKAEGKVAYRDLSPEDQRLLSSIMIRNSYQESDLMNMTLFGSTFGISVDARYQLANGQNAGVAWVFDITP